MIDEEFHAPAFRDLPADLCWRISNRSSFERRPEWADSEKLMGELLPPVARKPEPPKGHARVDLSQYMERKGDYKYTCPICHYRYTSKDVTFWWRAPVNKYKKREVPCCPECGTCGFIPGWHDDLNDWEPEAPMNIKGGKRI